MKSRIVLYAIIAGIIQIALGYLTGRGEGSVGLLLFIVMVELDKDYSFRYLLKRINKNDKSVSSGKGAKR